MCQHLSSAFLDLLNVCPAPSLAVAIALDHGRGVLQWDAETDSWMVGRLLGLSHPIVVEQGL